MERNDERSQPAERPSKGSQDQGSPKKSGDPQVSGGSPEEKQGFKQAGTAWQADDLSQRGRASSSGSPPDRTAGPKSDDTSRADGQTDKS